MMKIAIIGAGAAGLVAEKYSLQHGYECDVFEQTGSIGGTWVYTDHTDVDEDGVYVHTSMYKGLTTNFPKELMSYEDFSYPVEKTESYIGHEEVLEYFHSYADTFNLKGRIQFFKRITNVTRTSEQKWELTIEDVKTHSKEVVEYDIVIICTGRFFDPVTPEIEGQHLFKGEQSHSRFFRTSNPYKNLRVLIIGGSYSGQELAVRVADVAERVFLSHRKPLYIQLNDKLISKPEVIKITEDGAVFCDGTTEKFDAILYCTGFRYVCPFLSKNCKVTVEDNWVRSLYKQIVNIEYPSMFFIGLPYVSCGAPLFDLQVRFALATLESKFKLPPKTDMLKELEEYMQERRKRNVPDREAHLLGTPDAQKEYLEDLSETAGISPVRPVIHKLYSRIKSCIKLRANFKIVDDNNFIVVNQ